MDVLSLLQRAEGLLLLETAGTRCGRLPPGVPCPCTAHLVVGNAGNREFPYHNKDGSIEAFQSPQPSYEESLFHPTQPLFGAIMLLVIACGIVATPSGRIGGGTSLGTTAHSGLV